MKYHRILALCLAGTLLLTGCGASETAESSAAEETATEAETTAAAVSSLDTSDLFSDRDMETGYDEADCAVITLTGDGASCSSNAVEISGDTITITDEGTYLLSGTLEDGMVIVSADDSDKVQLVLEADKVFLTTASGSANTLSNGGEYVDIDENSIDAVIFSKTDLTLNGEGTLIIEAATGHGVVSKDGLNAAGGNDSSGFEGRGGDSFAATEGAYITISGGYLTVNASGDGIDSNGDLTVTGVETYVSGPTDSANGTLDYSGSAVISGGIFVAAGSSGMAQNFGSSSTQGVMMVTVSSGTAGDTISLSDSDGTVLVSWQAEKAYSSVIVSCPDMEEGATYTLTTGETTTEITMDSLVYSSGSGSGGMGGGSQNSNAGGRSGGMDSRIDGQNNTQNDTQGQGTTTG